MKFTLFLTLVLGLASCKTSKIATESDHKAPIEDNAELIEIYRVDQADRRVENIDWDVVLKRDRLREVRIYELLDSNLVRTSLDYHNAAMIFQHGGDSTAYGMAVKLMRKSIDLDSTANKWLLAAAIDRYRMSKDEPQIYGTQYLKFDDGPWQRGDMDTTVVSDAERIEYGVETLAQQREKERRMNLKSLSAFLEEGKTVDEIIEMVKSSDIENADFNASENGLNNFGYDLLEGGKMNEALKVFKLNTELYPEGYNTWDSYGECLMALGQKKEGVKAYKKSLELNPGNKTAERIIKENN